MSGKRGATGRRKFLAGLLALFGLGAAGVAYDYTDLFGRGYPRTKYDDLLTQLGDRDSAARLGVAVVAAEPDFQVQNAARELRSGPGKGSLGRSISADIARGRLSPVQGWLLPDSLVLASGIAAKAQAGGL